MLDDMMFVVFKTNQKDYEVILLFGAKDLESRIYSGQRKKENPDVHRDRYRTRNDEM